MPEAWLLCKLLTFYVIILYLLLKLFISKVKDNAVTSSLFVFIQKLVFLRGNLVGTDHPLPAVAEALLSVHCSLPSSVVLIVDEPGMFNISSSTGWIFHSFSRS